MLHEESTGKVFGLLATALCSMAFLFAVTVTNASFSGPEYRLPDPLGPANVVALVDRAANGYGNLVADYLVRPAQADLAFWQASIKDNASWVMDNADRDIVKLAGLASLAEQPPTPLARRAGSVAGASLSGQLP